jgi:hypothetical protein
VTSGALVCVAVMGYAVSAPGTPTVTGFTLAQSSAASLNAFGLQFKTWWFYKYATGADSGTYAGTCTSGNAVMAFAFRVAGWTGSGSPFADSLHEAAASGAPASVASFTPGGDNSLLTLIMLDGGANYPAGWVEATNAKDIDGDTITLASLAQTTASATGTITGGNADGTVLSVATLRQATSIPHGSASGTYAYTGTASGHENPHGAASGAFAYTGAAAGHMSPRGAASGAFSFTGSAAGHHVSAGAASGALVYEGSAAGHTDPRGEASGTLSYVGTAAGSTEPHGDASGALEYTGAASGHAPTVGVPHGDATGTYAYVGAAAGHTDPHGAAAGAYAYIGTAHGFGGSRAEVPSVRTLHGIPVRWTLTGHNEEHTLTGTPVTRTLTAKEATG